jgi:CRP/FNR family cyclic AMP-dependent transcriptional regulator
VPDPSLSCSAHIHLPLLQQGKWFTALGPLYQKLLLDAAHLRHLQSGERLFARGAPSCGLYAVLDGGLQFSALGGHPDHTREAIIASIPEAHWFGELSLLDGLPRSHTVSASSRAVLLHIPHAAMARLLARYPEYWCALARLQSYHLRMVAALWEEVGLLPAAERLPRRLLLMAERYHGLHDAILPQRQLRVSQQQLALMLSISRQTVNSLLKELERRGLIGRRRGMIEILDFPGLRAACSGHPPSVKFPTDGRRQAA